LGRSCAAAPHKLVANDRGSPRFGKRIGHRIGKN
jgi:hypothetical protein